MIPSFPLKEEELELKTFFKSSFYKEKQVLMDLI